MDRATQELLDRASALAEAAKRAGADASDAVVARGSGRSVSVRHGKVEATSSGQSDAFSLRVFVGNRTASVTANKMGAPADLAARAVAMARAAPENPFEGLADSALLAKNMPDLELVDTVEPDSERLTRDALAIEEAALGVKGVTNSGGAGASAGTSGFVLVTSHGFCGQTMSSRFSRSCSVIAGEGTAMERDYDYTSALHFADLETSADVGIRAGTRAVRRLGARQAETGRVDVVFDPRVARGIAGHLAGMVNGTSVARKTSLLREHIGQKIMRSGVRVSDDPLRVRGVASRPFDGEGVAGKALDIVEDGILRNWLLSSASARELGLETNGRGARAGTSVVPSSTNFAIEAGDIAPEDMIKTIKNGFYVSELFGHGVDFVTGQYSRGASGFWIENGELSYPVSEVTLSSDLLHMFARLTPANDLDRRYGTAAPTLLIEGMTLAGK